MRLAMATAALTMLAGAALAQTADRPPAEGSETVIDYGEGADLVIVTQVPLGPDEAEAMRGFRSSTDYFGAFAVDPGPGDWFYWVTGYQTQALAMEVAYVGCRALVPEGADCVVHARIDPAGYAPRLGKRTELGAPAARNWREFYLVKLQPGRHGAFAMSNLTSGAVVDGVSQADADSTALVECEDAAADAMRALSGPGRDAVRAGGHNVCRVVDRRLP